MLKRANLFGYGEVNQYNRSSTLMSAYKHINLPNFMHYVIKEKGEVYNALKSFFRKRELASNAFNRGEPPQFPVYGQLRGFSRLRYFDKTLTLGA